MTIRAEDRYACFFCGYGGSCQGAHQAGLECAIAIDNNDADPDTGEHRLPAIETRAKNIGDKAGVVMDIKEFNPGPEHAARYVTASPPCKRFSTAAETWDEDDDCLAELDKDIKNLGVVAIEKALAIPEMEYYVMENVKGLLSRKNHDEYLIPMVKSLRDKGFAVEWQVYNASLFGACQARERLIMIASKSGRKNLLPTAPVGVKKKLFEEIMDPDSKRRKKARWNLSTHVHARAKEIDRKGSVKWIVPSVAKALKEGGKWEARAIKLIDDLLPTITCAWGGGATRKKVCIFDPVYGHRHPTLLEGLRGQDHPDIWLGNLPKNESQAWNMVGNAVPACLMAAVMSHLRELDKYYNGERKSPPPAALSKADNETLSDEAPEREVSPLFEHPEEAVAS